MKPPAVGGVGALWVGGACTLAMFFSIRNGTVNCIYRRLDLYQQLAHVVSVSALVLFG
jgi:hypothetical protein